VIRDAALAGAPAGSIASADHQTAGRGRRGRTWTDAPATAVMLSYLARPRRPVAELAALPLVAGVAVCDALPAPVRLRWPNDVVVDGRKLAGILVETSANGRAIFGIGVNTCGSMHDAPEQLRPRLVTLPDLNGRTLSRQRLLADLVPRLIDILAAIDAEPAALANRVRPLCSLTGQFVRLYLGGDVHAGVCRGITADGELVLETERGCTTFRSGSLTPPGGEWRGDE
jgi:BirA family biotin operon repressor/biotin-[acetyl-CoA-carboxylase] ligase